MNSALDKINAVGGLLYKKLVEPLKVVRLQLEVLDYCLQYADFTVSFSKYFLLISEVYFSTLFLSFKRSPCIGGLG